MGTARLPVFAPHPHGQRTAGEVGVVTWNVQHAAPARADRQATWLASCAMADVVVLTEVAGSASGDRLMEALAGHGYVVHLPDSAGDYRVAVASRVGGVEIASDVRVDYLPHRWIAARLSVGAGYLLAVVGMYVPSRGAQVRRNEAKSAFQDAVSRVLPTVSPALGQDVPVLVMGDLNVVEPGHRPHHKVFGLWEYDFYRAFVTAGFTDCFRWVRPDADDHSWYGRSGNGYRFDHIFVSTRHTSILRDCHYDHAPRRDGMSDHAVMVASLDLSVASSGHRPPGVPDIPAEL